MNSILQKLEAMNNIRNRVQLIGNLGKDVELKQTEGGSAFARASLATKDIYKNNRGERVVDVQWHQIVGWGKIAENMQVFLTKGREVAITGKLRHRSYQDAEGQTKNISEIVVNEFLLLS
jgi:single-strand DNA-binding protein